MPHPTDDLAARVAALSPDGRTYVLQWQVRAGGTAGLEAALDAAARHRPAAPGRPQPYPARVRLASQIGDARRILSADGPVEAGKFAGRIDWARRCGELEAILAMVCDTAEAVLADPGEGDGRFEEEISFFDPRELGGIPIPEPGEPRGSHGQAPQ